MVKDKIITLSDLQNEIKDSIEQRFTDRYWITAEISEIKNHYAGHCYMDLIDRKEGEDSVSAKAQAIIWANSYRIIRPFFETTAGQPLSKGMHVLLCVQVQFSSLYGLSLVVTDIDPTFSIGEQELKRQQTIKRLKDEGMLNMNSSLPLPALPKRIAVISSEQAAGYRDFIKQLQGNEFGFRFCIELFQAPMQGADAPEGIISAMDRVAARVDDFDLLCILRGGGSAHDLACFDDYDLAVNIAQFPLPVIVGVGHDHDYHIADMVAHTSVKTPTALADFLIDIFASEEQQLLYISRRVSMALQNRITEEKSKLQILEHRIIAGSPFALLERGYALLHKNGKRVTDIDEILVGDEVDAFLKGGKLKCIVKSKENEKE
ncbi:MAG TPA: exodeoxyribonuclease VII large subunit [Bacteroidales bacterium]|nr:exodeoxyribonuclease VII large subunit [Bacteroidales bacterium]HRR48801.1 exodeoxyribonuclease VII large subunit [Bacteroidales bacterium]HRT33363.1 exodeoxyribonuclease VII large subunit [Bacteroidales bacterium]